MVYLMSLINRFNLAEAEFKDDEEVHEPAYVSPTITQTYSLGDIVHSMARGPSQRVYRIEQNIGSTDINGMFNNLSSLLSGIIGDQLADQLAQQSMDNIIDQIMRHDQNKYGAPPAAKTAIENLSRGSYKELSKFVSCRDMKLVGIDGKEVRLEDAKRTESKECSVCKDEFESTQHDLVRMPCMHIFHNDCIMPWLDKHNSCPTCRFELPTDDEDYEKKRNPTVQEESNSPSAPAVVTTHTFNIRHLR
jgi:E3 ubiquitin-protein ligase RNF115/126